MALNKFTVALTGGIASGKSTIANIFVKLGITILDADQIVHEILMSDNYIKDVLLNRFSNNILNKKQQIDKKILKDIIYTQDEDRIFVENLLHSQVRKIMLQRINNSNSVYCLLVIPLLIENLPNPLVKHILVININEKLQYQRAIVRDQETKQQLDKILSLQTNTEKRLKYADDVIDNNSNLQNLSKQIQILHKKYLKLSL